MTDQELSFEILWYYLDAQRLYCRGWDPTAKGVRSAEEMRHIRHAADLTLSPQKAIVVELWNAV
jgi:hypothetical protein